MQAIDDDLRVGFQSNFPLALPISSEILFGMEQDEGAAPPTQATRSLVLGRAWKRLKVRVVRSRAKVAVVLTHCAHHSVQCATPQATASLETTE